MTNQPSITARVAEKSVLDLIFTWLDGKESAESAMSAVRDHIALLKSDADVAYVVAKIMALASWLTQTDNREEIAALLDLAKSFFPRVRAFAADAAAEGNQDHGRRAAAFLGEAHTREREDQPITDRPSVSGPMARFALSQS